MKELAINRSFRYNSVTLPDPNPSLAPDQVREFYAAQYPELNNAVVEGPESRDGVATYQFIRAAGAKGAGALARPARDIVAAQMRESDGPTADAHRPWAVDVQDEAVAVRLAAVAANTDAQSTALELPGCAFGLWG